MSSLSFLNRDAGAAYKVLRGFVFVAWSAIVTQFPVSHDSAVPLEAVDFGRGHNSGVLNESNEQSICCIVHGCLNEDKVGGSLRVILPARTGRYHIRAPKDPISAARASQDDSPLDDFSVQLHNHFDLVRTFSVIANIVILIVVDLSLLVSPLCKTQTKKQNKKKCFHNLSFYNIILTLMKKHVPIPFRSIACIFLLVSLSVSQPESIANYQYDFIKAFCGRCESEGQSCRDNINYISQIAQAGNFNASVPLSENQYNVTEVQFHLLEARNHYRFPSLSASSFKNTSGLACFPQSKNPRGIVVFFHPTIINRLNAPSIVPPRTYRTIGAYFASQNFITVFPDSIGQGRSSINSTQFHPYGFYGQQNARAAINLLNSPSLTEKLVVAYGKRDSSNPFPLVTSGFGEGATYSIWFGICNLKEGLTLARYCYSTSEYLLQNYSLKGLTGGAGPYNLQQMELFLKQEVGNYDGNKFQIGYTHQTSIAKPILSVLTLSSLSHFSDKPFPLHEAFLPSFYDMNCSGGDSNPQTNCNLKEEHVNLSVALSSKDINGVLARAISYSALSKENNGYKYTSPSELVYSNRNSVLSFINKSIINSSNYQAAIADGTNVGYGNINRPYPAFLFSLQRDSIVPVNNTRVFAQFNKSGLIFAYYLNNSKYKICSGRSYGIPVDHPHAMLISTIFAASFINTKLIPA